MRVLALAESCRFPVLSSTTPHIVLAPQRLALGRASGAACAGRASADIGIARIALDGAAR